MIKEEFKQDVENRLHQLAKMEKVVYNFTRGREKLDQELREIAQILKVNNQDEDLNEELDHVWDLIFEVNSRG